MRNPVLGLPAFSRLATLHPAALHALAELLQDIQLDAADRAEQSWISRKAPVAAYWRAVSEYAGHIRRAIRRITPTYLEQLSFRASGT